LSGPTSLVQRVANGDSAGFQASACDTANTVSKEMILGKNVLSGICSSLGEVNL
jgi:hypothetical protein